MQYIKRIHKQIFFIQISVVVYLAISSLTLKRFLRIATFVTNGELLIKTSKQHIHTSLFSFAFIFIQPWY